MTDDTTTWLKKNPVINPLRRSLKTSLRFHVNTCEMDASIMSNPGKIKDQQIFIPRMLLRPSMGAKKLKTNDIQIPAKSSTKSEVNHTSKSKMGTEATNMYLQRKSFLPVKSKPQSAEKPSKVCSLPRPVFLPRSSGRKNTTKRDLIQKILKASQNSSMNSSTQKIPITAESSIIRSILKKKRASLGRRSQTSDQKGTKATKKVLFEMFENVEVEDKENELSLSVIKNQSDSDFGPLDEPTVFLNFPKSRLLESSPMENIKDVNSSNFMRPESCGNANIVGNILKVWKDYMENFNILRSERNSLENSFQIYVDQSLTFQNQLKSYFKTRDEIYNKFSELEAEVEENLRKTLENGNEKVFPKSRKNSLEGKSREKLDKIKLSEKSKAIKKSTGKSNRILKTDLWMEADDSFTLVEKKQVKALL